MLYIWNTFCRYLKTLEVCCIIYWFWFAKNLFKDRLTVYERANIDQTLQILIWRLLYLFRQWNICYLFIKLANNGLLIFLNFIQFCFNKIPEKYSQLRDRAKHPQQRFSAKIFSSFNGLIISIKCSMTVTWLGP